MFTNKIITLLGDMQEMVSFTINAKEITRYVTCSPSCITSVLMKDGTYREIENYHGNDQYPERLKRFEGKIDSIIGIRNYVGKG